MVPKCIHIWQGQVTNSKEQLSILVVFQNCLEYPSDSKPNTVACSKFEFPLNCQKDTETAMRRMYGSL